MRWKSLTALVKTIVKNTHGHYPEGLQASHIPLGSKRSPLLFYLHVLVCILCTSSDILPLTFYENFYRSICDRRSSSLVGFQVYHNNCWWRPVGEALNCAYLYGTFWLVRSVHWLL